MTYQGRMFYTWTVYSLQLFSRHHKKSWNCLKFGGVSMGLILMPNIDYICKSIWNMNTLFVHCLLNLLRSVGRLNCLRNGCSYLSPCTFLYKGRLILIHWFAPCSGQPFFEMAPFQCFRRFEKRLFKLIKHVAMWKLIFGIFSLPFFFSFIADYPI